MNESSARAVPQIATTMSEFGDWLSQQMDERKLSLRDVADVTGVSPTSVRGWRTGFSQPSWENCQGLATALGMDVGAVRELAGYSGAAKEGGGQDSAELTEVTAIWQELESPSRESLLAVARALRDQQRGKARGARRK